MCQGHHPRGVRGTEWPLNVPRPPSSGRAGRGSVQGGRTERVRAAILGAGGARNGRLTCQGRHPPGGRGADLCREGGRNVPGRPSSRRAGHKTAAERVRAVFLREGRARICAWRVDGTCQGGYPPGGRGTEQQPNVPGRPSSWRARHRTAAERVRAAIILGMRKINNKSAAGKDLGRILLIFKEIFTNL